MSETLEGVKRSAAAALDAIDSLYARNGVLDTEDVLSLAAAVTSIAMALDSLAAVMATKGGEPPAVMTTDEFADTAESGWYRVRFMSGDDPADPDSWEPWHCVEVYAGDEYNGDEAGFIDGGQRVPFWIMKDSHRYQWGAPVVMPDDESLGSVVEPKGGGGADVPAPAVPMEGEPGPSVLLGAARASIARDCTCVGSCKGADGLAPGWRCAKEAARCDAANAMAQAAQPVESTAAGS